MKFLSTVCAITLCLLTSAAFAETSDVTLGGFDPTGSPTASISDGLAANAALRNTEELLHYSNDPSGGNPAGKVTLVDFFDYDCPHCMRMYPIIENLIHTHPNLRVVYKMFPILSPGSELAARAAIAANKQGKFAVYHRALMQARGKLSPANIEAIAVSVGLNIEKFKADLNSTAVSDVISFDSNLATKMGINGIPAVYITKSNLTSQSPVSDIIFIYGESTAEELQAAYDKFN